MALERLQHLWNGIANGDEWRKVEVLAHLEKSVSDDLRLSKLLAVLKSVATREEDSPRDELGGVGEDCPLHNLRLLLRLAHIERRSENKLELLTQPSFEDTLHFIAPKMLPPLDERKFVDVFTCGSNDRLSLGNPLGTRNMKRIYFPSEETEAGQQRHFNAEKIEVGPASTLYIGRFVGADGVSESERSVFVSGKFGARHHLLPRTIHTDEEIVCASVGMAHVVMCSRKSCYLIGDNSRNQLGCGPGVTQVDTLRRVPLPDVLLAESGGIAKSATSSNHTVLAATGGGLFVTGTNVGQMGSYASRQYTSGMGGPKSFTRLLAPNDSFNKAKRASYSLMQVGTTGNVLQTSGWS